MILLIGNYQLVKKKVQVYNEIEQWSEKNFQYVKNIADRDFDYSYRYLFTKENKLDTIFSKSDIEYLIKQNQSKKIIGKLTLRIIKYLKEKRID